MIAKHLKIILEDINNFVRLELALNSWSYSIDELVKSFSKLGIILQSLSCLTNEILSVICTACIHHSVVVCLSLKVYHGICGLQTNFQLFSCK